MNESAADKGRAVDGAAADRYGKAPSSREAAKNAAQERSRAVSKRRGRVEYLFFRRVDLVFHAV